MNYISFGIFLLLFTVLSRKEFFILFLICLVLGFLEYKIQINIGFFNIFQLARFVVLSFFAVRGVKNYFPKKNI
ncbi:MAG: hypothetical protein PHY08_06205 [Candidatus Cloacimonetes bacterium]|jgi:membrane protein YqaA with SNARE-associated domain|nr:hypothetical protein [Candidatus Cloacimonadota bacterium]